MTTENNDTHGQGTSIPDVDSETAVLGKMYEQLNNSGLKHDNIPEGMKKLLVDHMNKIAGSAKKSGAVPPDTDIQFPNRSSLSSKEQVEIHSMEVQEILGYVPNWIICWGIMVIIAMILIFLTGSWFVKYPDVVVAEIEMISANPPVFLTAPANGRLSQLLVSDQEEVTQGEYLAILETTADYRQILEIKAHLKELRTSLSDPPVLLTGDLNFGRKLSLGEVQVEYDSYLDAVRAYREFFELKPFETKLFSVRAQLTETRRHLEQLASQTAILKQQYALSHQQYEHTKAMYEGGTATQIELENSQAMLLPIEFDLTSARIDMRNADLHIIQLEQSLVDLLNDSLWTKRRLLAGLRQSCDMLMDSILSWERRFVLVAPIEGIVSMLGSWTEYQNVSIGDKILAVLPTESANTIGRLSLPLKDAEKVRAGLIVNAKFENNSHTGHGIMRGFVESKSLVSDENGYAITVLFPDELNTNTKSQIRFSQKIKGRAEIIIDDHRLLERVFSNTRSYFNDADR